MEHGQVDRREPLANLRLDEASRRRPRHAEPELAEGNDVPQTGAVDDIVARVEGPGRFQRHEGPAIAEQAPARQVLTAKEGREPVGKGGETVGVGMIPGQRAGIGARATPGLVAEEGRQVVIGGFPRQDALGPMKSASSVGIGGRHLPQERRQVAHQVGAHDRGRDRGITHEFPRQHVYPAGLEDPVDVIEVVQPRNDRFPGHGGAVDQKTLIAVHQVEKGLLPWPGQLHHFHIAEIARGGLPFVMEGFGGLIRQQTGQLAALVRRDRH